MGAEGHLLKRIPRIKFPQRHPTSSASSGMSLSIFFSICSFFFFVFPLLLVIFIVSFICCYDFLLHIKSAQWFLHVYIYMTQFKKEISGSISAGQFLIQNALYYGSFMFCASLLCCFVKLNTGSLLFFISNFLCD